MDYRQYLQNEFEQRCQSAGHYSLRQFARDLHIPASRLSEIFNRRRECSLQNASHIVNNVAWPDRDKQRFIALVTLCSKKQSRARKAMAEESLKVVDATDDFKALEADVTCSMSDWYHHAILELTYLKGFQSDPKWIANKLGVNTYVVDLAISRLVRLKQLRWEDTKLVAAEDYTAYNSGVPVEAIRRYHMQVLDLAKKSIAEKSMEKRDVSAITFAAANADMPRLKEEIKRFRRRLAKIVTSSSESKDQVMTMSVQLFGLCQESQEMSA